MVKPDEFDDDASLDVDALGILTSVGLGVTPAAAAAPVRILGDGHRVGVHGCGAAVDVTAAAGRQRRVRCPGTHWFEIVIRVPEWFTGAGQICVQAGVYATQSACFASFATKPVTIG